MKDLFNDLVKMIPSKEMKEQVENLTKQVENLDKKENEKIKVKEIYYKWFIPKSREVIYKVSTLKSCDRAHKEYPNLWVVEFGKKRVILEKSPELDKILDVTA